MLFQGFQRAFRPLLRRQITQRLHGRSIRQRSGPTPQQDYFVCIAGLASLAAATALGFSSRVLYTDHGFEKHIQIKLHDWVKEAQKLLLTEMTSAYFSSNKREPVN